MLRHRRYLYTEVGDNPLHYQFFWVCGQAYCFIVQRTDRMIVFSRLIGLHSALAIQAHDEARMFSKDGGLGKMEV